MSAHRPARRILPWAVGYAALVVWLTWPLGSALSSKLPNSDPGATFDTLYSTWVMSWIVHALTTAPFEFGNANIYWPDPLALYYGPAGFGAALYALPGFVATGNAAFAANTAFLTCITLTALALHEVAWRWTGSAAAGFVAAWTLLMHRWYLWGLVGNNPHYAAIQYFPLIVLLAAGQLHDWRRTLALLALVVLQGLTDPVYVAPAVIAPLGVLALTRLPRPAWRHSGWRLLGLLAAVPLALAPLLIGYVWVRLANPSLATQSPWARTAAMVFRAPASLNALFWRPSTPLVAPPTTIGLVSIGLIAAGGVVGLMRWRSGRSSDLGHPWAHAALWVAVGTLISLTPIVVADVPSLDGTWQHTRITLPQNWLAITTPLYRVVRVPERLGVAAMIGLCLMSALAFAELARVVLRPLARAALALAIAALIHLIPPVGMEALPDAFPTVDVPQTHPVLLRQLRSDDGPLLELPAVVPLSPESPLAPGYLLANGANAAAMYRSTLHWRPLLNGYSSYWPAGFMARARATDALPAPDALRELVCETSVRTILVNLRHFPPDRRAIWERARAEPTSDLRLIGEWSDVLLFAVTMPGSGEPGSPSCEREDHGDERDPTS